MNFSELTCLFFFRVKTIFAQLPRYVNRDDGYRLHKSVQYRKSASRKFFLDFIRNANSPKQEIEGKSDYDITGNQVISQQNKVLAKACGNYEFNTERIFPFIPLPPEKLMRIIVKPKYIALGKVFIFLFNNICYS